MLKNLLSGTFIITKYKALQNLNQAFLIGCASLVSAGLAFSLQWFLSFNLSKSQFSIFIFLNSLMNIGVVISLLGIQHLWLTSQKEHGRFDLIHYSIIWVLVSSLLSFIFLCAASLAVPQSEDLMHGRFEFIATFLSLIIGLTLWELYLIGLQTRKEFLKLFFYRPIANFLRCLCIILPLVYFREYKLIAIGNAITGFLIVLLLAFVQANLIRNIRKIGIFASNNLIDFKIYWRKIKFLATYDISWIVSLQLPILLGFIFSSSANSANLGVAFIIFSGAMILPVSISSKYIYPVIASDKLISSQLLGYFKKLFLLSFLVGIFLILISDFLIQTLFDEIYIDAASILKILGLWLPLKVGSGFLSNILLIIKEERFLNLSYLCLIVLVTLCFLCLDELAYSFLIYLLFPASESILLLLLASKIYFFFKRSIKKDIRET